MAKLAGIDMLTADPAGLSVAVVMPVPLRLRTGDVVLSFDFDGPAPYGPVAETLALEIVDGGEAPGVPVSSRFERLQLARVADADMERLVAAQAKVRSYRQDGGRAGKGSLSVRVTGACRDGALGEQPLIGAIYMRTDPQEPYFAMMRSLNLTAQAGSEVLSRLEPCDGAAGR